MRLGRLLACATAFLLALPMSIGPSLGYEPADATPTQPSATMAADTARWGPIIKASGVTGD